MLKAGGAHAGLKGHGRNGKQFSPPSAQLQADFKTLQTDEQTLQSEIPANLTAAVKADQAIIQKAFASVAPAQRKGLHPGGPRGMTPPGGPQGMTLPSDPTADLASHLEAAGVSTDQANAVVADLKNLQSALTSTDPTLQAKIAADKAAIAKDGGPTLPADAPGMPAPGMPGMF